MSLVINVANHPTFNHFLALLEKTTGRDKLLRTIQYWARFFSYILYRKGYSKETIAFWKLLQSQLGLARKLFRAGKPLSHFKLATKAYSNKTSDPILRVTSLFRNIAYFGYFSIDTLVWINTAKIYNFHNFKKTQQLGAKLWLTGLVLNIFNSLRKIQLASSQESALVAESEKDTAQIKRVRAEKAAATHQLLWDSLDSSLPASSLGYAPGLLDDGVVGLAGLITSIFGLKQQWRITA